MPFLHLAQFGFHEGPHNLRIGTVYHEPQPLLDKLIVQIVQHFFQRQESFPAGLFRHAHKLLDQALFVKADGFEGQTYGAKNTNGVGNGAEGEEAEVGTQHHDQDRGKIVEGHQAGSAGDDPQANHT
ncbi:hypothetical protein FACS189445_5190 [Spirochaetia bacterium]|nr:hypothetical protein FACS189445_5190 [Spirochaetia bacterium]